MAFRCEKKQETGLSEMGVAAGAIGTLLNAIQGERRSFPEGVRVYRGKEVLLITD